jgi:hypothetical protein
MSFSKRLTSFSEGLGRSLTVSAREAVLDEVLLVPETE